MSCMLANNEAYFYRSWYSILDIFGLAHTQDRHVVR